MWPNRLGGATSPDIACVVYRNVVLKGVRDGCRYGGFRRIAAQHRLYAVEPRPRFPSLWLGEDGALFSSVSCCSLIDRPPASTMLLLFLNATTARSAVAACSRNSRSRCWSQTPARRAAWYLDSS